MKKIVIATTATVGILTAGFSANVDANTYTNEANYTQTANTSEVYKEFIAAGGTKAMWDHIVMPESSGNPNAVNELGYRGLGQTKEYWGTGSVTEQTKGMINYAKERYGSVEAAIAFRQANNWW